MSFEQNIVKDDSYENLLLPLQINLVSDGEWEVIEEGAFPQNSLIRTRIPKGLIVTGFGYTEFLKDDVLSENYDERYGEIPGIGDPYVEWSEELPFTDEPDTGWSFDRVNSYLYVRGAGGSSELEDMYQSTDDIYPNAGRIFKIIKCIYPCSLKPISWYQDPLDQSSPIVKWQPLLKNEPTVKSSVAESIRGENPIFTTSFDLQNTSDAFTEMIDRAVFDNSSATLYRMSGNPHVDNIREIGRFQISDMKNSNDKIRLSAKQVELNKPVIFGYDRASDALKGPGSYSLNSFGTKEEDDLRRKIPTVFGHVRGIRGTNISHHFVANTSYNRNHAICYTIDETLEEIDTQLSPSVISSYVISGGALGAGSNGWRFRVGDRIRVKRASGTYYPLIEKVDRTAFPIEITVDTDMSASGTGQCEVARTLCSRAFINQNGTKYELMPFRDYTTTIDDLGGPGNVMVVNLTSTAESNVGASTLMTGSSPAFDDHVIAHVYGPNYYSAPYVYIGDTRIFSHRNLPAVAHPVAVIYKLLTDGYGLSDSDLDIDQFESLYSWEPEYQSPVSFRDPISEFGERETCWKLIMQICNTYHLYFFKNLEGKWTIIRASQGSGTNWNVKDKDVIGDISYRQDSQKVVKGCKVEFDHCEFAGLSDEPTGYRVYEESNCTGLPIYRATSILTFRSMANAHDFNDGNAKNYHDVGTSGPYRIANHFGHLAGVQRNVYTIRLPKSFSLINFGDTITFKSERIAGYPYVKGTERSVVLDVVTITRATSYIEIEAEDRRYKKMVGRYTYSYI